MFRKLFPRRLKHQDARGIAQRMAMQAVRQDLSLAQFLEVAEELMKNALEKDGLTNHRVTPGEENAIVRQAAHYIAHYAEEIRTHNRGLDTYQEFSRQGGHLSLRRDIANWVRDDRYIIDFKRD